MGPKELNTVESHALPWLRALVNVTGECFANEIFQSYLYVEKYEIEVTKMGQNNPLFLYCWSIAMIIERNQTHLGLYRLVEQKTSWTLHNNT